MIANKKESEYILEWVAVGRGGGELRKRQKYEKLSLVTVQTIPQQGIFNLTNADYLIAANVYVGFRSKHPDNETVNDVFNDLQENDINVIELDAYGTDHCK